MIALWQIRNDDRHGRDKETREAARHEVLPNELCTLYTYQMQYPPSIRNLLRQSFDTHCQETASQIEDWLCAYRVTFQVMHNQLDG